MLQKETFDQGWVSCCDFRDGIEDVVDRSISLVLTDLPYGTTRCKWDAVIPFIDVWDAIYKVIRDNRAIVLNSAQPFTSDLISSNHYRYAYQWYWDKCFAGNFVQAKRTPLRTVEDICVFSTEGAKRTPLYFPQMEERETPIFKGGNKQTEAIPISQTETAEAFTKTKKCYTQKFPTNLLRFNVRSSRQEMKKLGLRPHPTQKPIDLCEYLIRTYTKEGETVLDLCLGSGTTAVAAMKTGRRFIGFEKNSEYFETIQQRLHYWSKELKNHAHV